MAQCVQMSLCDSTCQAGGWDPDGSEGADIGNYAVDEQGRCWCSDDPYPGDSCENYQPQWGNCSRCGEDIHDCSCEDSDAESCGCAECEGECEECGEALEDCQCD